MCYKFKHVICLNCFFIYIKRKLQHMTRTRSPLKLKKKKLNINKTPPADLQNLQNLFEDRIKKFGKQSYLVILFMLRSSDMRLFIIQPLHACDVRLYFSTCPLLRQIRGHEKCGGLTLLTN